MPGIQVQCEKYDLGLSEDVGKDVEEALRKADISQENAKAISDAFGKHLAKSYSLDSIKDIYGADFEEADSNNAASEGGAKSVVKSVVKKCDEIVVILTDNPSATRQQLATATGLSVRGVEKNLGILKKSGRIRRIGPDKGGHWEVIE